MTTRSPMLLLLFANLLLQIDCGRICFSCTGMAENDNCHNVATCQDDEVCFTQKYKTEDNKTRFDVGCSYPELCRKDSMGIIFGKRTTGHGHVLCHHCCMENVCNSAFTCTDNFKAPSLSCMYCSGIDMVDKCNTTISCESDEVCFIQKYRTLMNQVRYDLGCKRSTICLNGYYSNIFGRRSNDEKHLLCESCCGGSSLCNSDLVCSHHNQSSINGSCTSTNGCQSNMLCLSGKCQCHTKDHYWSTDRCKSHKDVNQVCELSFECKKPLVCLENICICPKEEYWDGSRCTPKKQLNSICKTSEECFVTLFCIHGVCKCDRIDYWTGQNCSTRKTINSSCNITKECEESLHCINGACSCFDKDYDYWNGTMCAPKKLHGQSCSSSKDCSRLSMCYSPEPHGLNRTVCLPVPKECADIPFEQNDVFTIYPTDIQHPKIVLCVKEAGIRWTVIQRRFNGSVDFYRTWQDYKEGFGNVHSELWLGNDLIHLISSNSRHKLRVNLEVMTGGKYFAEYSTFRVEDESTNYLLHVTDYNGTAGDSMYNVAPAGRANRASFSTKDRDHSMHSCPRTCQGGWWYNNCEYADINGRNSVNGNSHIMNWNYDLGRVVLKSMMMITRY